ncbi:MAG: redox-regulated ATPase YchF [Thermomicrobiales bacterium]
MATQLVIIGRPATGKTTVFNALTHAEAATGTFGVSGDEPNLATVKVPDPRLDALTDLFNPERKVPADVQYLDVAGIAKGIAEKGMGGQLLGHLSQADALVHVVRAFEDDNVPHSEESVDPLRDIETLNLELLFSDLGLIEKRIQRIESQLGKMRGPEKEINERELAVLTVLRQTLEDDKPLRDVVDDIDPDEYKLVRGFGFLTAKPLLILLNIGEDQLGAPAETLLTNARARFAGHKVSLDVIAGKIEMEIGQLDDEDAAIFMADLGIEESALGRIIRESFDLLGLMPFFTVGPEECRAWTIRRGETAVEAAGAIHSDIQRGFIRAQVIAYDDMIDAKTLAEVRKRGTLRREGKTYVVADGDIIEFLFNV